MEHNAHRHTEVDCLAHSALTLLAKAACTTCSEGGMQLHTSKLHRRHTLGTSLAIDLTSKTARHYIF